MPFEARNHPAKWLPQRTCGSRLAQLHLCLGQPLAIRSIDFQVALATPAVTFCMKVVANGDRATTRGSLRGEWLRRGTPHPSRPKPCLS